MQDLPLRILFLADDAYNADVVRDHIQAFFCHSQFQLTLLNPCQERMFFGPLAQYDVIVIHYSIFILSEWHLPPNMAAAVRNFRGLKVQIIQDEYRQVDAMATRMAWLGIHTIFTVLQPDAIAQGYPQLCLANVTKHSVNVTGFPPRQLLRYPRRALTERPFDIVYRGRDVPFFLGRLGQEKKQIGVGTLQRAAAHDLTVDIAWREDARIYGDAWYDFIASGRATLASESGSSVWDFTGEIETNIKAYLAENPTADFEAVFAKFLTPYEGKITYRAPSPRLFEAICLGTALILFPGTYSGIFIPERHFISLQPDFSNFKDVVEQLRDTALLERMVNCALREIIIDGKYDEATYVAEFDTVIAREYRNRIGTTPIGARSTYAAIYRYGKLARLQRVTRALKHKWLRQAQRGIFYGQRVHAYIRVTWGASELSRSQKIAMILSQIGSALARVRRKINHRLQLLLQQANGGGLIFRGKPQHTSGSSPAEVTKIATQTVPKYACHYSHIQRLKLCDRCTCVSKS